VTATLAVLPSDDHGDWRWQLRNAARTSADLKRYLSLSHGEEAALSTLDVQGGLPLGITPHFLSLMTNDPHDPLRRQVVPHADEFLPTTWDRRDPLGEEDLEVVPFLVHRYPDRVLLLATDRCASYCRFCTRKRMVGQGPTPQLDHLQAALAYVAATPTIREVIISGGDALVLADDRLAWMLTSLRAIPHLDVIRIATRMLAFAPQRVTPALTTLLQSGDGPAVYVLSHFNHPNELPPIALSAIESLVNAGIPVLNQTVLMRGVNDNRDTLVGLFRRLTRHRARPYYLHQCDLAPGTDGFRVPLDEARRLYASLRGHISGLSIPTFVVDIPGGLGKAPLHVDPVVGIDEQADAFVLQGFQGKQTTYPRR
jgi:lysine 2,3-aminomutase